MKKIKLVKSLVGSILILAMFLGLSGVASANHTPYHGDNPTVRVDTGAVIWEVKVDAKELDYYLTARWHGDHSLRSYYQSSGKPFRVGYMRMRALLYHRYPGEGWGKPIDDVSYPGGGKNATVEKSIKQKIIGYFSFSSLDGDCWRELLFNRPRRGRESTFLGGYNQVFHFFPAYSGR